MQKKCLVCDDEKPSGSYTCKMCGMMFNEGVEYSGFYFCSAACKSFFIEIKIKSPEMIHREIVI